MEFKKNENAQIITYQDLSAVLTKDCISFWSGGILVFDCPIGRIISQPKDAIRAIEILYQMIEMDVEGKTGP